MEAHDQHGDHHDHHDHHDAHASIAHWKQPIIATALALVATIGILVLLTQMVTDVPKQAKDDDAAVLSRLKPVGELVIAPASAPKGQLTGEQVFGQVCKTCHETGLAGAPKVGDKAAWAKVDRARTGDDGRSRDQGHPRDAAEGRQSGSRERRSRARGRVHGEQGRRELEGARCHRLPATAAQRRARAGAAPPPVAQAAAPGCVAASRTCSRCAAAAPLRLRAAAACRRAAKPDGKKIYDVDVHGLSRRRHCRRAEVRRQGGVGAAHRKRASTRSSKARSRARARCRRRAATPRSPTPT